MTEHVLIVDPSPGDTKDIKHKFVSSHKSKVTVAGRTSIGVEELRTKHVPRISFIIADIDQPDTGELGAIDQLRAETDLPILILSKQPDPIRMFQCLVRGADLYLTKQEFDALDVDQVLLLIAEKRKLRA